VIPLPVACVFRRSRPVAWGPRGPRGGRADGLRLHEDCLRPRAAMGIKPSRCPSGVCRHPHSTGTAPRAAVSRRPHGQCPTPLGPRPGDAATPTPCHCCPRIARRRCRRKSPRRTSFIVNGRKRLGFALRIATHAWTIVPRRPNDERPGGSLRRGVVCSGLFPPLGFDEAAQHVAAGIEVSQHTT
jgi:hypothetical protein